MLDPGVPVLYVLDTRKWSDVEEAGVLPLLSGPERGHLETLRHPISRREFLAGRWLIRSVLARRYRCPYSEIVLEKGPWGKPRVAAPRGFSEVEFNLSHAGGVLALVAHGDGPVGVDVVDQLNVVTRYQDLAHQFFRPEEARWIDACDADRGWRRFVRVFAQKEAHVKRMGTGLATALDSFPVETIEEDFCDRFRYILTLPDPYCHVVAAECAHATTEWHLVHLDPGTLLQGTP